MIGPVLFLGVAVSSSVFTWQFLGCVAALFVVDALAAWFVSEVVE
jgi:hypothetical protein